MSSKYNKTLNSKHPDCKFKHEIYSSIANKIFYLESSLNDVRSQWEHFIANDVESNGMKKIQTPIWAQIFVEELISI